MQRKRENALEELSSVLCLSVLAVLERAFSYTTLHNTVYEGREATVAADYPHRHRGREIPRQSRV